MIKVLLQSIATMLILLGATAPASAQTDPKQTPTTQQKPATDKTKPTDPAAVPTPPTDRPSQNPAAAQGRIDLDTMPPGRGVDQRNADASRMSRPLDSMILLYGQPMYRNRPILENVATSSQHSTMVGALRSANLNNALAGAGPFTVFAPVNAAFDRLPAGTLDQMTRSENRSQLTGLLNYHVVAGLYDFDRLAELARSGNNTLRTVAGPTLTVVMNGPHNILVRDESGHTANIVTYDIYQSNGVVHSIDTVLMPRATSK